MLADMKRFFRRVRLRMSKWVDHHLDYLGLGVVSTYLGRTFFFAAMVATFISLQMWLYAGVIFAVIFLDTAVQIEVLSSLRKLMAYEMFMDITTKINLDLVE